MGLRPVLEQGCPAKHDDGPNAAGACVLSYRFWKDSLKGDPTAVIGRTIPARSAYCHHRRCAGAVGAVSVADRDPGQCGDQSASSFSHHGHGARPPYDRVVRSACARRYARPGPLPSCARSMRRDKRASQKLTRQSAHYQIDAVMLRDQITSGAKTILWVLLAASGLIFYHCVFECRQSDFGALGAPLRGNWQFAPRWGRNCCVAANAAGGKLAAVGGRSDAGRSQRAAHGGRSGAVCLAFFRPRPRFAG